MAADAKTIKQLFCEATEKSLSERAAFLDAACAGDSGLRRRVEALLVAHEQPDRLLDQPIAGQISADGGGGGGVSLDFLQASERANSLGRLGHYEVLEVVGCGGMGIVLRAFDVKLQRVVAIKALASAFAMSGAARQRFVREARSVAAVTHDNVIDIHAVEEDGPVPYLVMQFIDGCTLQEKLDQSGPLPVAELLRIGLQIAEGLSAAHRHGLIHRDIKPANILLENGIERVKITDFGLARAVDDVSMTRSGVIAGTPAFMSPEQAAGEPVDFRSDLFSLGSVLYAACAGHPPFRADTTMAVLKRVCEETPRSLREINTDVPEWLESLIVRLHAKKPAERFESAAEVASLLRQRLAQWQSGGPFTDFESSSVRRSVSRSASPTRRTISAGGLFVAAIVIVGAISVGWFLRERTREEPVALPVAASWTTTPNKSSPIEPTPTEPAPSVPEPWRPRPPATAEELAGMSSPFDDRQRDQIPREVLQVVGGGDAEQSPAELVAVLSSSRPTTDIAFSPDGQFIASGGFDNLVHVWDLSHWPKEDDAPPTQELKGHTGQVWSVGFSPDGRWLASGSFDGTIIVWDVASGRKVIDLIGHSRVNSLIAFRPDSQVIAAGGEEGVINRWNISTGLRLEPFRAHVGPVRAVAYSPDARWLASAGEDQTVQVLDAESGRRRHLLRGVTKQTNVAFSPDGKYVAATRDFDVISLCLWDVETGEEVTSHSGHTSHAGSVSFHPLGEMIATGAWDGTAHLWNKQSDWNHTLPVGTRGDVGLVSVAWSPDGRYLAATRENQAVCVFRIAK